jgi:hypothetical protein
MSNPKYNYEYLQQFCKENGITLTTDYIQKKIQADTKIDGICKNDYCNEIFCKLFRNLTISNGFCKKCTSINCKNKAKQTCLNKYGVDHPSQNKEVMEKFKQTCLDKYGVEHPSQNKEVREKFKQTCLKNWGCEYPSQNEEVKQQKIETCLKNHGVEHPSQNKEVRKKSKTTCLKNYGVEHPSQNEEIKQQKIETCLKNYGVENPSQNEEVKQQKIETCLKNHGVEYPSQNEEVKKKAKQTCINNYGVEHPSQNEEVKKKTKQTCLQNWGCEYPFQNEEIREKSKKTSLINYGVEYPMQNAEYSENISKNAHKLKHYCLPSGNLIKIQGYENFMLDELFQNECIHEDDIIISRAEVPEIWYLDSFAKRHRYYVDAYIPSQNRMIECKSTWTAKKKKDNIYLKQQACKDAGYLCEIWVYNSKGEKVECIL